MNRHPVDLGLVVGVRIHLALVLAPVVFRVPVVDKFLQVGGISAVFPIGVAEGAGQAGPREAVAKIFERRSRHRNRKWLFLAWTSTSYRRTTGLKTIVRKVARSQIKSAWPSEPLLPERDSDGSRRSSRTAFRWFRVTCAGKFCGVESRTRLLASEPTTPQAYSLQR
jgi:hypothetical protein